MLSESIAHVLWECSAYSTCRVEALKELLGTQYSYVLGSENWEDNF